MEFHARPPARGCLPYNVGPLNLAIFADFQHGVFTPETLPQWRAATQTVLTAADSQTTDIAWGNILDFAGCTLLFANEREVRFAMRDTHRTLESVAEALWYRVENAGTTALFVKLGARGLSIYHAGPTYHLPAQAHHPIVDPIGAGDALLAYAAMAYAVTPDLVAAGELGSRAAAIECAQEGNVPITVRMMLESP